MNSLRSVQAIKACRKKIGSLVGIMFMSAYGETGRAVLNQRIRVPVEALTFRLFFDILSLFDLIRISISIIAVSKQKKTCNTPLKYP
jgi:hypothetical protein